MKGHYIRTVKGRTPAQRANAQRFSQAMGGQFTGAAERSGLPASSWWLDASREELRERLVTESPRMAQSKFGRYTGSAITE